MLKKLLKTFQPGGQALAPVPEAQAGLPQAELLVKEGNAAEDAGQLAQARALYERAVAIAPQLPAAHLNLGIALEALGEATAARAAYERVLALDPGHPFGAYNLGKLNYLEGRRPEAKALLRLALARRPEFAEAWVMLGTVLEAEKDLPGAEDALTRALRLKPDHAGVLYNLAGVLRELGRTDDVEQAASRAAQLEPRNADYAAMHAAALVAQCRPAEALVPLRRAISLAPERFELRSRELFLLHLVDGVSAQEMWERHRALGAQLEASVPARTHAVRDARKPRLRLGIVSEDLRTHPVGLFLRPVLEHIDRKRFEIYCYSSTKRPDSFTKELRALSDRWIEAGSWHDLRLADVIAADGIDILLDLGGHTGAVRLGTFAAKPAPVQVSWVGYLDTTGLTRIDARLTDARCDPPGAEAFHSERLLRFAHSQWCYRPFLSVEPADQAPCERNGFVTFGSLNNASKITEVMAARWGRLLKALPSARLLLVDATSARKQEALLAAMQAAGAARSQIEFLPRVDLEAYYRIMDGVDIALDSHPYGGGTTTFDALWMGVPVVAAVGELSVSRSAASLLQALGLDEWVAPDIDGYEAVALARAADLAAIAQLRRTLRERLRSSPLLDQRGFAAGFAALLEQAWSGAAVAGQP